MEETGPGKQEIQEIFRKLRTLPANRACFDCNTKNPTWASVTYGVFICIDCSAVHRSLGVHLSFVRSIQLDTNWSWVQLRNMQLGGNANAASFFTQHNCTSSDAQQKYNSRAAHLYKEKLNQTVAKYNKIHGNRIVFDEEHSKSPTERDVDFFDELHQQAQSVETLTLDSTTRLTRSPRLGNGSQDATQGPNVSAVLTESASPSSGATSAPRKSTIGQRKPAGKLGAKKVGLGAQKVKADFSEIEKEAEMLDQMKEQRVEDERREIEQRAIDEEKQLASMRLAYQDLSKEQKKREEQLKNLDPKKAQQLERLGMGGMGIGIRGGISHSAMSDIKSIEQDTPSGASTKQPTKKSDFFDDFEILDNSLSGFSSKKNSDWSDLDKLPRYPKLDEDEFSSSSSSSKPVRSSRPIVETSSAATDEAQKKFGNAKAISSDQFFTDSRDNDLERRTNLSRFDGSKSISSADYFGDGAQRNLQQNQSSVSSIQSTLQNVDLDDVKESVRQGVTKVAGRLTNLASGVMTSLQEKYGY